MPETVGVGELKRRVKEVMDEPLSSRELTDVIESIQSVTEDAISNGEAVNLFGLVKLTPKYKPAVKAQKGVADPFHPGETYDRKAKPAKVDVRARALKRVKDAAPSPTSSAGKRVR